MFAVYEQYTGRFTVHRDGETASIQTWHGYAGFGLGRNNPAMENQKGLGPLPRGEYRIGPAYTHRKLGPVTMNLTPNAANSMFGRDLFRIHGDNIRGDASTGCIVLHRAAREWLSRNGVTRLYVVRGSPPVQKSARRA